MERIHIDKQAVNAVNAYLEYRRTKKCFGTTQRIVGEDDGGKLLSEDEFKRYKETILPQRIKNRLYVSFGVPGQIDCKLIGPETPCFCTHRYKQHYTELPKERPILLPCRVRGCQCVSYQYVHMNGSRPARCQCKHTTTEHSESPGHPCKKCSHCSSFRSPFTCGCGQPGYAHATLVETKEERMARGHPVGEDVPYAAMGGLTGFSSLADGYLRLDPSGIGPLSYSTLTSDRLEPDHVFERANTSLCQTAAHEKERKFTQRDERINHLSEHKRRYFEESYKPDSASTHSLGFVSIQ